MISQAWLQVGGLIADFVGVALIALEWMLSQRQDSSARAIEEAQARQAQAMAMMQRTRAAGNPAAAASFQPHYDMIADQQRRMAEMRVGDVRQRYGQMRHGAVYVGLTFVVLGFVLQLLAAWPGCCAAIGIAPGP
jgi:hypothetical protein